MSTTELLPKPQLVRNQAGQVVLGNQFNVIGNLRIVDGDDSFKVTSPTGGINSFTEWQEKRLNEKKPFYAVTQPDGKNKALWVEADEKGNPKIHYAIYNPDGLQFGEGASGGKALISTIGAYERELYKVINSEPPSTPFNQYVKTKEELEFVLDQLRALKTKTDPNKGRTTLESLSGKDWFYFKGNPDHPEGTKIYTVAGTVYRDTEGRKVDLVDGDGKPLTEFAVSIKPGATGIESPQLVKFVKKNGRGHYEPLRYNIHDSLDRATIAGVRIITADGVPHDIPINQFVFDQAQTNRELPAAEPPAPPKPPPEYTGSPAREAVLSEAQPETTDRIIITGIKAFERRARAKADRVMQRVLDNPKGIWEGVKRGVSDLWKKTVAYEYFHRQGYEYFLKQYEAAQNPLAESSIALAEAKAKQDYKNYVSGRNVFVRMGIKLADGFKSNMGGLTGEQKRVLDEITKMREAGQITAYKDDLAKLEREQKHILTRMNQDMGEKDLFIRQQLGEDLVVLNDPKYSQLRTGIIDLIKGYRDGTIAGKDELNKKVNVLMRAQTSGASGDVVKRLSSEAELYASTIYDVAEAQKAELAGANRATRLSALDAKLDKMEIRLGIAQMGESTSLSKTNTEKAMGGVKKVVDWLVNRNIIKPIVWNEASVGTAVSAALALWYLPSRGVTGAARWVGGVAGGSAVAGIFAGFREYGRKLNEYRTYMAEREAGVVTPEAAYQRKWFERYYIKQRTVDDMVTSMRSPLYNEDGTLKANLTAEDLSRASAHLADAGARSSLSFKGEAISLIERGPVEQMEESLTTLQLSMSRTERDIRAYLNKHADVRAQLMGTMSVDDYLKTLRDTQVQVLTQGRSAVAALNNPLCTALGDLDSHNPEIDILRRRFGLVGAYKDTDRQAEGVDAILKEFRRAAKIESARYGAQAATLNFVISTGFNATLYEIANGFPHLRGEGASNILRFAQSKLQETSEALGISPINHVEAMQGGLVKLGNNMVLDENGNLDVISVHPVTGAVSVTHDDAIPGFAQQMSFDESGNPTTEFTRYIHDHTNVDGLNFSVETHTVAGFEPYPEHGVVDYGPEHYLTFGETQVRAPEDLYWTNATTTDDGIPLSKLIYLAQDENGATTEVIVADHIQLDAAGSPVNHEEVLSLLREHPLMNFQEAHAGAGMPTEHVVIPGLSITDSSGSLHQMAMNIPAGTHLVPDGKEIYDLVDNEGTLLINNMHVTGEGAVTNMASVIRQAEALNMTVSDQSLGPIHIEASGKDFGDVHKNFSEVSSPYGSGTGYGWFGQTMQDGGVSHIHPAANLETKILWKTVPDWQAHQTDETLPGVFFAESQQVKVGELVNDAIAKFEVAGTSWKDIAATVVTDPSAANYSLEDHAMLIAYDIGRVSLPGREMTDEELEVLRQFLGGGLSRDVIPHELTIMGHEVVPGAVTFAGTMPFTTISVTDAAQPVVTQYEPIFVAIAPLDRYGLERGIRPLEAHELAKGPLSIDSLGGTPTPELLKTFEERRSKTLKENPHAELNDYNEVDGYLKSLDAEYRKTLEQMSQTIGPMATSTKLSIAVPVANHQEGKNIYQSLKNYTYQTANKAEYEILLFANRPDYDLEGHPVAGDNTMAEIERFKKDFPDMPIKVVEIVIPREQAKIGRIRKYATDLLLLRHYNRGQNMQPLIIASNDADNKGISPSYINNFIQKFESNKDVDGYLGQLDWDPEVYTQNPLIHVGTRLFQYLGAYGRKASGGMPSSGANFAFRSNIYAAIGGYMENSAGGEDVTFGKAIIVGRGNNNKRIQFAGARQSRLYTSARRSVNALKFGLAPIEQWNRGFSAFDDDVRKMDMALPNNIDYENPTHQRQFLLNLETVLDKTLDTYEAGEKLGKNHNMYKLALRKLGVEYTIIDGKLQITDASTLLTGLQSYKDEAKLLMDVKSGRVPASELAKQPRKRKEIKMVELHADRPIPPKDLQLIKLGKLDTHPAASATILQNPEAQLDADQECKLYLERQDSDYLQQLHALNAQIATPMDQVTEAVIPIPVAGAQEKSTIYGALRSYAQQTLDPKKFEVILFVNMPARYVNTKKADFEGTLAEIERARNDFPHLNVRVVKGVLPDDQVRIGNIRKIVNDLALLRRQEAGIHRDIPLVSNDADNQGIAPEYLDSYIRYFSENPDKEGAVGNLQFDPSGFIRFPALAARTEFVTRLDKQGFKNGNVDLYGNNSVMKSSIYAAIGAYPTELTTGEQEWTGNRIRELRQKRSTLGYAGDGTLLITSLRRGIITYIEKRAQQLAFGDAEAEARMRALNIEAMPVFDYSNTQAVQALQTEIEEGINDLINTYEGGDRLGKNSWFYQTNLASVGISYRVDGDPKDPKSTVVITDISKFIERQKRMQERINAGELNMAKVYAQST